jgi:hypothetical protein
VIIDGMTRDELRRLYEPLKEQALARVDLALKVAVMAQAGIARSEMAVRLDASPGQVRRAVDDPRAIADEIELGDRPGSDV